MSSNRMSLDTYKKEQKVASPLEASFVAQVELSGLPLPVREYRGINARKFRFDFAWPERKIAVEINGGIWRTGGHSSGVGVIRDYEKMNLAQREGWRVFQFHGGSVEDGSAVLFMGEILQKPKT